MSIIYFEGIDKVGKTTIAKELAKEIMVPYFKDEYQNKLFSHDSSTSLKYTELAFCELVIQTKLDFIKDRGFLSEFVYSKALGRHTYFSLMNTFIEKMVESNSVIVYLTRTKYIEEDDIITPKQSKMVKHWYGRYIKYFENNIISINLDDYIIEIDNNRFDLDMYSVVNDIIYKLNERGII